MKKVLVADDDARLRELVAATLGGDFHILYAATGEEAWQLARGERPDLILLDIMMPRMDGLEACRRIKGDEETRGITVVMLTALGTGEDIRRGKEAGADDYFVKPFSPITLLDKVYEVLEKG